jgi:soluble lytic murein transglycosylase-like protein
VDPALVVAVSWQESRFKATAAGVNRNSSIDRGLMQLNSSTFSGLSEEDFYNPYLNADHGTSYLRQVLDLSGNTVTALAMYNAGPGRVGSLGAPRMTLEYVDRIFAYRDSLVQDYYGEYASGSVLISSDIRPVKNPDYL